MMCLAKSSIWRTSSSRGMTQLPPGLRADLLVHPGEAPELGRMGRENPGHDSFPGGIADGGLAHREGLKHGRMRLLIGPRHDADSPDHTIVVDLAGSTVLAGPLGGRPAPDPLLVRERNLIKLPIRLEGRLRPRLLDHADSLFVDLPIVLIEGGAIHRSAGDV